MEEPDIRTCEHQEKTVTYIANYVLYSSSQVQFNVGLYYSEILGLH